MNSLSPYTHGKQFKYIKIANWILQTFIKSYINDAWHKPTLPQNASVRDFLIIISAATIKNILLHLYHKIRNKIIIEEFKSVSEVGKWKSKTYWNLILCLSHQDGIWITWNLLLKFVLEKNIYNLWDISKEFKCVYNINAEQW